MASVNFEKILQVLDVIEETDMGLSIEEIHARLDIPRSTLYRYLRALTDSSLVASLPDIGYTLGPRIAELDYKMRTRDPLIIVSRPVMAELVQTVPGVALLCRLYRDTVLCVHQEAHPDAIHSGYERGRPRPLLRGAASRIMLAYMGPRTIAKLFQHRAQEFNDAQLGRTLVDVKAELLRVRQTGWVAVEGQVTPGATGVAAPLLDSSGNVVASLSLTLGRTGIDREEIRRIAERVVFCAGIVTKAISGKRVVVAARAPSRIVTPPVTVS